MAKKKQKSKKKLLKYSFTTISDYFLDEWSQAIGLGATVLYIHLLKYCYQEKNLAWPTLKTLSEKMGVSERSIINYRKILVRYGLIKNIFRRKQAPQNNIYQLVKDKELFDTKSLPVEMNNFQVDSENISPCKVKKSQLDSEKYSSCMVKIFHPNHNNIKKNNKTTTKDAVVDFKKEKDKGEEKMQEVREKMKEFDFTESFTEKVLKEFPPKKIEEKLELYAGGRPVRNPMGWLMTALKEDYQEDDQEPQPTPHPHLNPLPSRGRIPGESNDKEGSGNDKSRGTMHRALNPQDNKKYLSREEAVKRFQLLRQKLKAMKSPYSIP